MAQPNPQTNQDNLRKQGGKNVPTDQYQSQAQDNQKMGNKDFSDRDVSGADTDSDSEEEEDGGGIGTSLNARNEDRESEIRGTQGRESREGLSPDKKSPQSGMKH